MRTSDLMLKAVKEQVAPGAAPTGKAQPREELARKFSARLGEADKAAGDKPFKGREQRKSGERQSPMLMLGKEQPVLPRFTADEAPQGREGNPLAAIAPGLVPASVHAAAPIAIAELHPSVERMAAAIAEVAPQPGTPTMLRIDFGTSGLRQVANEAVLTMNATGDLSVRVSGFVPPVRGPGRAEFEADLRRSLERRRLKLGEVSVAERRG